MNAWIRAKAASERDVYVVGHECRKVQMAAVKIVRQVFDQQQCNLCDAFGSCHGVQSSGGELRRDDDDASPRRRPRGSDANELPAPAVRSGARL
jgi:hypothetical protein